MNASNLFRAALVLTVATLATGCYDFHYDGDRDVFVDTFSGEERISIEDMPTEPRCVSVSRHISDSDCARTLCAAEYVETGRCELLPDIEVDEDLATDESEEVVSQKAGAAQPGACGEGWSEYIFEHTSTRKICDPRLMGVSRPNTDSDGYECVRRGEFCCAHWCVRDAE